MDSTVVIGDVQGCLDELEALLRNCGSPRGEEVVLVGDLVAKGPDSQGVVQLTRELGARSVLGNHDDRVLHARRERTPRSKLRAEHRQVLETLTDDDWRYLKGLPLLLELGPEADDGPETVVIHAGAVPGVPLYSQRREHLLTLRSIDDRGAPSDRIEGRPWASLWTGPKRIVFGHDAVRGLQEYPLATGLDTGCVYGGRLTGLVLPERKLVSVRARRQYAERKKKSAS
jgi:hypothetical protein